MAIQESRLDTTYLLAWFADIEGNRKGCFEMSTARIFRAQSVVSAGIRRGSHNVIAFCDYIHGDDYMTKDELRLIATCYLDGEYTTTVIDFRSH